MFIDSITGLDKIMQGDVQGGYVILITGDTGTLKTVFTFTAMNNMLKKLRNRHGVFVSLEQTTEEHISNMKSFGLTPQQSLNIIDVVGLREKLHKTGGLDLTPHEYIDLIMKVADYSAGPVNEKTRSETDIPLCFALDSLNALMSMSDIGEHQKRAFVHDLFHALKKKKVLSIIIWETIPGEYIETFLADGVIELGIERSDINEPTRYVITRKPLRGNENA